MSILCRPSPPSVPGPAAFHFALTSTILPSQPCVPFVAAHFFDKASPPRQQRGNQQSTQPGGGDLDRTRNPSRLENLPSYAGRCVPHLTLSSKAAFTPARGPGSYSHSNSNTIHKVTGLRTWATLADPIARSSRVKTSFLSVSSVFVGVHYSLAFAAIWYKDDAPLCAIWLPYPFACFRQLAAGIRLPELPLPACLPIQSSLSLATLAFFEPLTPLTWASHYLNSGLNT